MRLETKVQARTVRRIITLLSVLMLTSLAATAQTTSFTRNDIEFVVELPSASWQAVSRVDVHDHVDFINGADRTNGYLHLQKRVVAAGTTAADIFREDEKFELQSLPGYVACTACTGEAFEGDTFAYEYTSGGKPMAGRIYYLQLNPLAFYVLHFTVAREKLGSLRSDMDAIAS